MYAYLDGGLALALAWRSHRDHEAAHRWVVAQEAVAISPMVEAVVARTLLGLGESPAQVEERLREIHSRCSAFVPDDISHVDLDLAALPGHCDVADAYQVELARRHGGVVATLDRALAAWADQRAFLVASAVSADGAAR